MAEPSRDADGHWTWRVKLEVASDLPEGRHAEIIDFFTDDPMYTHLRVPVTVVKRSRQRVTATPETVTLTIPAGQPVPSRLLLVRDADNHILGLITLEDVLEQIIGDIEDEHDRPMRKVRLRRVRKKK